MVIVHMYYKKYIKKQYKQCEIKRLVAILYLIPITDYCVLLEIVYQHKHALLNVKIHTFECEAFFFKIYF